MRNKVYYAIFERDGKLEYHVNRKLELVKAKDSMSGSIPLNSPIVDDVRRKWEAEAEFLELIKVEVSNG